MIIVLNWYYPNIKAVVKNQRYLILLYFELIVNLKLLIAYGSRGKLFHLQEFAEALEKENIRVKLVKDTDYSNGFPSKKISDWFFGD